MIFVTDGAYDVESVVCERERQIRELVSECIHNMLDEAHVWTIKGPMYLGAEPQWHEIRDAAVSVLFSIESEMGKQEAHADYVVKECL